MGLKEAVINRFNALALTKIQESVHIKTGEVGVVNRTDLIRGTITVDLNNKTTITLPGKDVAPLDEVI